MTTLDRLQRWYAARCDGDWEHQQGIEIGTLDNPGWRVSIDLEGTALAGESFVEVSTLEPESEWVRCWVEDSKFQGAGGAFMLDAILGNFLDWAEDISREADA